MDLGRFERFVLTLGLRTTGKFRIIMRACPFSGYIMNFLPSGCFKNCLPRQIPIYKFCPPAIFPPGAENPPKSRFTSFPRRPSSLRGPKINPNPDLQVFCPRPSSLRGPKIHPNRVLHVFPPAIFPPGAQNPPKSCFTSLFHGHLPSGGPKSTKSALRDY